MSNYRQIRPSWMSAPVTTREETTIQITPAATTSVTVVESSPTSPPEPTALTGTAAIYQQVIASLQNQVTSLQTMAPSSIAAIVPDVPIVEEMYPTGYYQHEEEPPCLPPTSVEYIPLPGPQGPPGLRGPPGKSITGANGSTGPTGTAQILTILATPGTGATGTQNGGAAFTYGATNQRIYEVTCPELANRTVLSVSAVYNDGIINHYIPAGNDTMGYRTGLDVRPFGYFIYYRFVNTIQILAPTRLSNNTTTLSNDIATAIVNNTFSFEIKYA